MSTDNTEIKDWQDDLAEKDIISTAWQAEFFGPEEKIEDEQELAKFDVHVIYKNTKNFTWYYPQIKAALLADSVKEFVEYHGIVDATDNDIEELKAGTPTKKLISHSGALSTISSSFLFQSFCLAICLPGL